MFMASKAAIRSCIKKINTGLETVLGNLHYISKLLDNNSNAPVAGTGEVIDDDIPEGVDYFPLDDEDELDNTVTEINKAPLKALALTLLETTKFSVPIDTGSLMDNGRVLELDNGYAVVFGMGINKKTGKPINYATYVHEIGYTQHKHGKAKYLEDTAYDLINKSEGIDFDIKIDYDVTFGENPGCMVAYLTYDGNSEGYSVEGIKRATSRETVTDLLNNDNDYHKMWDIIYNMTLEKLTEVYPSKGEAWLQNTAWEHVSDFIQRGSALDRLTRGYERTGKIVRPWLGKG